VAIRDIGFIGLGAMGLPMARNLLRQGYKLHVAAHRNREPVELLKREGAMEHAAPADFIPQCQAIVSILPTDQEIESVLLSEQVMAQLPEGCILIEMTSGSPGMMKIVHEAYSRRGVQVLDAPVSGGTIGAEKGTLTVMAGGGADVLDACRPVLEAMAQKIYLVGSVGAGKAIKAINQMLAGVHMIAAAEALALSGKLGVDPEILKQVIGSSSGASWMLLNKSDAVVKRDFTPGFKLALMRKDVQIAVNEANDLHLPLASLALKLYQQSENDFGGMDFSAISNQIRI
jgi:3-hydroxyisobutyrate dehydrogenase-like beta-hydroxyacid dehydrogenase